MEWDSNARSEWGLEIEVSGFLDSSSKDRGRFSDLIEEGSILSGEAMIGLKLGRQTDRREKLRSDAFSSVPDSSYLPVKRSRGSHQSSVLARCQVEGCNLDLASAKEYYRRHRICADHSKSPKVFVAGMERRFCQQCSRLHDLSEFDDKKRSCRRRLSTHNARRRRPQSGDNKIGSTRTLRNSTPQSCSNFNGGCVDMMSNGGLSDISSCFNEITPRRVDHDGLEANSSLINGKEVHQSFPLEPMTSWGFRGHEEPSSFNQFVHEHDIGLMQTGMPLEMASTSNTQIPHDFDCFCSD